MREVYKDNVFDKFFIRKCCFATCSGQGSNLINLCLCRVFFFKNV